MTAVSCGIDWAQDHHDIAVVDEQGAVVCAERISNDAVGSARLLEILTEHDPADARLEVAIETSRGLLVAGLRAARREGRARGLRPCRGGHRAARAKPRSVVRPDQP